MALLSEEDVEARLGKGDWRREGAEIVRERTFADFRGAMAFANRVADAAEEAGHHPDILAHGYKHVALRLSTHSEGGLTERDFALARTLDALG